MRRTLAEFAGTTIVIYAVSAGLKAAAARTILRRSTTISVTLWSEDMQDGMGIAGRLTIRNPFP